MDMHFIWKVGSYNESVQQFGKAMSCVRDTISSKDCWIVLVSSRADRTNCKFDIQCWKVENKKAVNAARLTEKRTVGSARRLWSKLTYNFFTIFSEKKLPLSDTQIASVSMSDKQSSLFSVFLSFNPVLFSIYCSGIIISASSSVLSFKTGLISTFD